MKRNKCHIILTWMLLVFFTGGQVIVYTHNHGENTPANKAAANHHAETQPKQTITENCQLCYAMHHNSMAMSGTTYFATVVITSYFYKAVDHNFISISLILSGGRAPPIS